MINKLIITAVLLLGASLQGNAQQLGIGLKGGVNYSNIGDLYHIGGSVATGTPNITFTPNHEIGYQFGLFIDVKFNKFFVRPEGNYVSLKNNYELPQETSHWSSTAIDIPLLFGYAILEPISIYAGPVYSSISSMELEGIQENLTPFTYKDSSLNIAFGVLIKFAMVGIDFRYQLSMDEVEELRIDMNKSVYGTNVADLLAYKPSQFMINIQVSLFDTSNGEKRNKMSNSIWRNHNNL